ncbi:arylamine N-acetyltransferase [Herbihabitans rhizosphaerae]|uniref:Arylamine N-acetyltransferase n=1 Tax=Herbihabitans rhizosphaerae TaxID=1872711 RepID=A0A4Q7L6M7_9PSEU|nr:arylamine N-acetyltransferase [Herbihabitans rhizosphaerae]
MRARYLRRLGFSEAPEPDLEALTALHRAQVEKIPYETLWIKMGEPRTTDPRAAVDTITGPGGRGGYCYHLNGAFSELVGSLGFDVRRHIAGVQGKPEDRPHLDRNHLGLTVHGLPTDDCPDGAWLVDLGLGDGFYDPIPLVYDEYRQGPFTYRLRESEVDGGGWRFDHAAGMSFVGFDTAPAAAVPGDFTEKHRWLSTSPDSGFAGPVVVSVRTADAVVTMRGCRFQRFDADGLTETLVSAEQDWFGALADVFGVTLDDVDPADRVKLWTEVRSKHEEWLRNSTATQQE